MLHKKFHAKTVGGVDISKALVEKLKKNQVWAGGDGSFVAVIGRNDSSALRAKVVEVLGVVNTELAAVPVPDEALWSQITIQDRADTQAQEKTGQPSKSGKRDYSISNRFKTYLYIRGQKCIGTCLAERIQEAYSVVDRDDASERDVPLLAGPQSSSISVSNTAEVAILGISRIWTSNSYRYEGIATRLLDCARSDFLYGMIVPKEQIAFSQPTESGGLLARKWFHRNTGWLVYVD